MSFPPEHEIHKRRFGRILGVGLLLVLFVAIVFGITVVKVLELGKTGSFNGVVRQEVTQQVKTP